MKIFKRKNIKIEHKHNWVRHMDGYTPWIFCEKCGMIDDEGDGKAGMEIAQKHEDNKLGKESITYVDMKHGYFGFGHQKTKQDLTHCEWEYRAEINSYWELLDHLVEIGIFSKEDANFIRKSNNYIEAHIEIYNRNLINAL